MIVQTMHVSHSYPAPASPLPCHRSCTDASTLVEAEHAIRAAVSSWAPASGALLQRISPAAQMERAYSAAAAAAAAAAGAPPPAGAGYGDAHLDAWQMVCEWVLGAAVPVWQELFHAPFVKRAKELIEACFKEVRWAGSAQGLPADCLHVLLCLPRLAISSA